MEENDIKEKSVEIIFIAGFKKGIPITKMKDTSIKGEEEKVKKGIYEEGLQKINDRIRSYRPVTIQNYKPETKEEFISQLEDLAKWDGVTWDFGEYQPYLKSKGIEVPLSGEKSKQVDSQLFTDFKLLVKSSALLRGYNNPYKVRGGTYQDVDDFFNFATIKLCERRLNQFNIDSTCRIWQNWPAYVARVLPQYLILYNKAKIDLDLETFWPMIKDKSGEYKPKEFGTDFIEPSVRLTKDIVIDSFYEALKGIPESYGYETDILFYLLYKISPENKKLISHISRVLKIQMADILGRYL